MKTGILLATLLTLSIVSCKKDKEVETPDPPGNSHYVIPNTVGSYWVYETVSIDSNGTETHIGLNDSIYIAGDSIFNGNLFTVYKGFYNGSSNYTRLERDSSGFVVGPFGGLYYSYSNFTDTLYTISYPMFDAIVKMFDSNDQIDVPAGTFQAIEKRKTYYNPDGGPVTSCGQISFSFGTWYADGIGEVKEVYGFAGAFVACMGTRYEKRLIDYHIEE